MSASVATPVRVRFAPSPTGYLHVGGARTALFNWLYAKHHGGKFILRIEDTDRVRSTQESLQEILESLKWMGLSWDEGPYYQSERNDLYREHAERLVAKGLAYKTVDPEKGGGEAILLKMPARKIAVDDLIYGRVEFDGELIKDQVLMKSDGSPAYNFCCVVDDALMQISTVIRGEDHLSNTPKQIVLYEALGLPTPRIAHVPLILGQDRSRLSKRHGATAISSYKQDGYLPEAMVNYLVLLGWSPGNDRELFTLKELTEVFDLAQVSRKGAVFSVEKLQWMNGQYLRQLPEERLLAELAPFLKDKGLLKDGNDAKLKEVACLLKERLKLLKDIVDLGACFFEEKIAFDEAAAKKFLFKPENAGLLSDLGKALAPVEPFAAAAIEQAVRGVIEASGMKNTPVIQAIRVALTGKSMSAGIFETMAVMGKETCLKRLAEAQEMLHDQSRQ